MKTYKTIDEQVEYLKDNKKIIVEDDQKSFFSERHYSSTINPYKEFFASGRDRFNAHIYKNMTNFSSIMKLIKMDDDFNEYLLL